MTIADSSHEVFLAHFPEYPVLPGFLIIDIFSDIFNLEILKIKKVKFLKVVPPNTILQYIIEKELNKTLKVVVKDLENKKVVEVICEYR